MQKIQILMLDDIDNAPAAETIRFALDGQAYEIDLSESNAQKFQEAIAPFIENARKVSSTRSRARDGEVARIRSWAREQGIHINARGRIPAAIMEKYEQSK